MKKEIESYKTTGHTASAMLFILAFLIINMMSCC